MIKQIATHCFIVPSSSQKKHPYRLFINIFCQSQQNMNVTEPDFTIKTTTKHFLFITLMSFSAATTIILSSFVPLVIAAAATTIIVGTLLIFLAIRTTVITWITVLVLLAFAGKRRRGVVKDGKKITSEVAMNAANIVIKEKGLFAFTGALILGFSVAILITDDYFTT